MDLLRILRAAPHTRPRAVTMKLWEPKRKCPKAIPTHLQTTFSVVPLKCSVKSYVTGSTTKCYFNQYLFMCVLTHDTIKWIDGCERSECHGLPVLCPRDGFWKQSRWPWNMIHSMPCRNPCRLYILLAFTCSVGPSSTMWSNELGSAPLFAPLRVLGCNDHGLSVSCVKWP